LGLLGQFNVFITFSCKNKDLLSKTSTPPLQSSTDIRACSSATPEHIAQPSQSI
jgi:hypothetical protein